MTLLTPAASDPTEYSADWMEFEALRSIERQTSIVELAKLLRRTGSTDALEGPRGDAGSELSQAIAEDAFSEIENRRRACGEGNYPFEVQRGLLRLRVEPEKSPYILLLLMSAFAPTTGHNGTAVLFERLCTQATLGYLGGASNAVQAVHFGSPRRAPRARLSQAIDALCVGLAEGGGCRRPSKATHLGDDGLDIVAWRSFPDSKEGKLVAFGQCAGGRTDWESKLAELDAIAFMKKWMRTLLIVTPIRLFFVPRRIPEDDWEAAGIDGGILFDRCRIVSCLNELAAELSNACQEAATVMLTRLRDT